MVISGSAWGSRWSALILVSAPLGLHNSLPSSKGDFTLHNPSTALFTWAAVVLLIMFPSLALLLLRDTLVVEQESIFGADSFVLLMALVWVWPKVWPCHCLGWPMVDLWNIIWADALPKVLSCSLERIKLVSTWITELINWNGSSWSCLLVLGKYLSTLFPKAYLCNSRRRSDL